MEAYKIKIDAFEGPFDLLFHLIEKNKIDIYDIPVSLIADQYMDYIFSMQEMDLEIASEFLVMASTLLHIKSRLMLPAPITPGEEAQDEADMRENLIISLIEYRKYKEFTRTLRANEQYWRDAFFRDVAAKWPDAGFAPAAPGGTYGIGAGETYDPSGYGYEHAFSGLAGGNAGGATDADSADGANDAGDVGDADGANDAGDAGDTNDAGDADSADGANASRFDRDMLIEAYRRLLDRSRRKMNDVNSKVGKIIEREKVPLIFKIREILLLLKAKPRFLFQRAFDQNKRSKLDVVTAFFAVLELTKQNRLRLRQDKIFGDITVYRGKPKDDSAA
jgi:chromatin segregation and condensation protein Rec8/ScpA/Scc1 (kleisin family)